MDTGELCGPGRVFSFGAWLHLGEPWACDYAHDSGERHAE